MSIAAFVNRSTKLTDGQAAFIVAALQVQQFDLFDTWDRDLSDIGGPVDIMTPILCADETHLPEGCYPMVFVDNADVAGALGYHSVDDGGKYYARIFTDLLLARGPWNDSVSECASHEYVEICLNPTCLVGVVGPKRPEGSRYQREGSDPVESDHYLTAVTREEQTFDMSLSNFVLPEYFRASTPAGARVDFLGTCPGPFQLAPGGYMLVSPNGLTIPTPIYAATPPAPERIFYKTLGRRFAGGLRLLSAGVAS